MVLAIGEQENTQDEDSVHHLLAATKIQVTGAARQQALYDQGMEDEATKQMRIAYATFLKGKDENVVGEYKSLNSTLTDEQNALWDYVDEMKVLRPSSLSVRYAPSALAHQLKPTWTTTSCKTVLAKSSHMVLQCCCAEP
eukprot:1169656-Rhodomonas_salina.2